MGPAAEQQPRPERRAVGPTPRCAPFEAGRLMPLDGTAPARARTERPQGTPPRRGVAVPLRPQQLTVFEMS